jgi:protein O-mannosyl-transferase
MNRKQYYFIIILLIFTSCIAFGRIAVNDFVNYDDPVYVTENSHIQSGITLESVRWAFSTIFAEFWHPLTWLSLMSDYHLYGLNAGGYHVTSLILHVMSILLLFWLFNRMTSALWKSAFVAAFFALHPLHVESVAWISERKDVLSAFFWMLTLCLYVYYTEKPSIKRYLLVLFCFACALMSKSIVITLPVIMILLDYWPLKRFESKKETVFLWQLKEKLPLFILSALFSFITIYAHKNPSIKIIPLSFRLANAPFAFVTYLEKTFWPRDMTVFYPFSIQIPVWQIIIPTLLIIAISFAVVVKIRRLPYLFVGWLWFAITLLPVIGIIQIGDFAMADRYHYLPSIGIAIMLAWGIPLLFKRDSLRKIILLPTATAFLAILTILTWVQCGYWKNSLTLLSHALHSTADNFMVHNNLGLALIEEGKNEDAIGHFNKAINIEPNYANVRNNRGLAYAKLGQYQNAIEDYNKAILIKPDLAVLYYNRAIAYKETNHYQSAIEDLNNAIRLQPNSAIYYNAKGNFYNDFNQYQLAIENYNKAISISPNDADAYSNRGSTYVKLGRHESALNDFNKVIALNPNHPQAYINSAVIYGKFNQYNNVIKNLNEVIRLQPDNALIYYNRGFAYAKIGQYQPAINDFNKALNLKQDYTDAYRDRGVVYLSTGNIEEGCKDARKACELGNCKIMEIAHAKGLCR